MNLETIENRPERTHGKILVVLPTLGDRLETLKQTLISIEQQRTDVDLTLVVVSPQDARPARELSVQYGAVLVDDPKLGISEAINRGILARSDETYYAWMGDDDLFRPGGLLLLRNLLEQRPDSIVAYGACEYIDPHGKILATSRAGKWAQFLLPWGPDLIPHPGSMILLDELEAVGNFDPSLKYSMDLDVFLKLKSRGKFTYTTSPVSAFRWHPDSLTVANRKNSSLESERVKFSHLPTFLRPFSALWKYPIRWASAVAARNISARA